MTRVPAEGAADHDTSEPRTGSPADAASRETASAEIAFTGERFVPGATSWGTELEHMARYESCVPLAVGKLVLDIASGAGYGSLMLASVAESVVGVDIDAAAVAYAAEKYPRDNLTFLTGSVTAIPLSDSSVDLVVSFETIEHLAWAEQDAFIREARRVLTPEGVLVVSTPNRMVTEARGARNEFHVRELCRDEFIAKLSVAFGSVRFHTQTMRVCSEIAPDEPESVSVMATVRASAEETYPYMIAVCSASQSPAIAALRCGPVDQDALMLELVRCYEGSLSWRLTRPLRWIRSHW